MTLKVSEIFFSIQGEGIDIGMPALFVRMAGCNMNCHFCDANHSVNEHYTHTSLFNEIKRRAANKGYVIFTGGEPLLQDIYPVVEGLKFSGYRLGLETNGTIGLSAEFKNSFDSISLSPKVPRAKLALKECTSLKIIYPYLDGITADSFRHFPCQYKGIQPRDMPQKELKVAYLHGAIMEASRLGYPWRLSPQIHKFINMR